MAEEKPPPFPRPGAYIDTDEDPPFGGPPALYGPDRKPITWEGIKSAKRAPNPTGDSGDG